MAAVEQFRDGRQPPSSILRAHQTTQQRARILGRDSLQQSRSPDKPSSEASSRTKHHHNRQVQQMSCIPSRHPMPDAGPDNTAPKPSPATHGESGPPLINPAPQPFATPAPPPGPTANPRCHRPLLRSRLAPRPPRE